MSRSHRNDYIDDRDVSRAQIYNIHRLVESKDEYDYYDLTRSVGTFPARKSPVAFDSNYEPRGSGADSRRDVPRIIAEKQSISHVTTAVT